MAHDTGKHPDLVPVILSSLEIIKYGQTQLAGWPRIDSSFLSLSLLYSSLASLSPSSLTVTVTASAFDPLTSFVASWLRPSWQAQRDRRLADTDTHTLSLSLSLSPSGFFLPYPVVIVTRPPLTPARYSRICSLRACSADCGTPP